MNTINAQSIINEVMAAHAIAPSEYTLGDFITFKTSARGTHRIINDKSHLQRFADLVRKNASAFGGGLIREAKARPAVSYASKTISLYKQLIEDRDYFAALQLAEEKLSPMFFFGTHGKAYMQVAPIPLEDEPRLVSVLNEDGTWSVIEPVSMLAMHGHASKNKRSRDAQIENAMQRYSRATDEAKEVMFTKAYAKPADQSAARAKWMADHGIIDDAAIAARIEEKATQDVAEVVAQAVAVSAIAEAMAPAAEEDKELVTCEAGESEAQESSTGSASGFTVAAYNTVTAMLASFTPTHAPAVAVSSGTVTPTVAVSSEQPATSPVESTAEPVAPVVETEYDDTPCVGPFDIPACISVYDHEGHLVYSEDKDAPKVIDRISRLSPQEPATTPDDTQKFNIRAKSGAWFACVYMIGTMYGLEFNSINGHHGVSTYTTHKERMHALEMMANALNTPPDGGLPIATVDAPTEAPTPPVAECTPDTPPMVSRAKPEHDLKVGDVVRSSWGYDQTNVNHYQITKLIGKRTVEVRELVEHKESTGDMTGHVAPVWGEFIGEPMRRTVDRHGHVNILREKFGRASKIEPVAVVHGVRCYASTGYSSYA